jgi:hypothetical protein
MYQQLWGYKVEEKLYLGVREQKRLNTTGLADGWAIVYADIHQNTLDTEVLVLNKKLKLCHYTPRRRLGGENL